MATDMAENKKRRFWWFVLIVIAVILAGGFYLKFCFVFGEGVKSGELNYVVYKGVVFKTYEGKLIQSGIRSKAAGTIQSYEFEFSVVNPDLARRLMLLGGRTVELHYKEYFGALPWRGFTNFVVDSIIGTSEPDPTLRLPETLTDTAGQNPGAEFGAETLMEL